MGVELLTERYKNQIAGVLSCYDRIIVQGTVPGWCYASGMTDYFYIHHIRIFDYPNWAEPCATRCVRTWCAFSQPWNRAAATSRGTTRKATRLSEAGRWQMPALLHLPH